MLELRKGVTGGIIVTLTELSGLAGNFNSFYYLFIFTHTETKKQFFFISSNEDDYSSYKYRYNEFLVDTNTVFGNDAPIGMYNYEVYEQLSSTNTDPSSSNGLVEKGKFILSTDDFKFKKYETSTSYSSYAG